MNKFIKCLLIFLITGVGSAFLGASGDATFVIGGISAVLYLIFTRKKENGNKKSGYSHSSSRASGYSTYSTKKYSSSDVARLLSSGNLYACRFEDGSGMTRIDAVERAKIIISGGNHYMEIPERLGGMYKLSHGYSHTLKGSVCWMNECGDNWYLMDQNKNIILH